MTKPINIYIKVEDNSNGKAGSDILKHKIWINDSIISLEKTILEENNDARTMPLRSRVKAFRACLNHLDCLTETKTVINIIKE